jgi:hypothetical protein
MGYNGHQFGSLSGSTVSMTSSLGSTIALRANDERTGLEFYNGSDRNVCIAFAVTCSVGTAGVYTTRLAPSGSFSDDRSRPYAGIVTVAWEAAATFGRLQVTELSSPRNGYSSF